MLITGGSLIQGSIGRLSDPNGAVVQPGNLEAVVGRDIGGGRLEIRHLWRAQSRPDQTWQAAAVVTGEALGPASMTQRRDGDRPGNFEVVVPERHQGDVGLAHYWFDNGGGPREWHRVAGWAVRGVVGPGAIVEHRDTGNLEAVVLDGRRVLHASFDRQAWRVGAVVTDRASGAPTLFQSSYAGHLEMIVPEGDVLVLYYFDGDRLGAAWRPGGVLTLSGDGPHGAVQGRYGIDPHRNFELLVPRGDVAVASWRDNSDDQRLTKPAGVATWGGGAVGAVALCSSDLGDGWLQALTEEDTSIYHLHRHRPTPTTFRWMRSACVRLDDRTPVDRGDGPRSRRLGQVTGESDLMAAAAGTPRPSMSASTSTAGVRGTDLGVTVRHGGRRFLLFGDTHWVLHAEDRITLDSIAEVVEPARRADLPRFRFHGAPLLIQPPTASGTAVTQREYDVPLDAFSLDGNLYVFFSSNHFDNAQTMSRSVLTRATDPAMPIEGGATERPLFFTPLTTFSSYRFINVSVELTDASRVPGFGQGGPLLLIWGSGAYRADDLRLALVDLRDPAVRAQLRDNRGFDIGAIGARYFVGLCGSEPRWSAHEEDARPLFHPAAIGELSVRWIASIGEWALLTMTGPDDPAGAAVVLRTSPTPWGPWSNRRIVLDWIRDALVGTPGSPPFIHLDGRNDRLGDDIFPEQARGGGAAYAPYIFDTIAQVGGASTLRYTLSTWNPYQTMLMAHDLPARIRLRR